MGDTFDLVRLARAARCSWAGLRAAWREEAAFRLELLLLGPLALAVPWLGASGVERALLWASLALVPLVELLNSAVEAAVDRSGREHHPLAGKAKDLGSAAVAAALVLAGGVWALVLLG